MTHPQLGGVLQNHLHAHPLGGAVSHLLDDSQNALLLLCERLLLPAVFLQQQIERSLGLLGLEVIGDLRRGGDAARLRVDHHGGRGLPTLRVVGGGHDHVQPVMNDLVQRGEGLDVLDGDAQSVLVLLGYADHAHLPPLAASQSAE